MTAEYEICPICGEHLEIVKDTPVYTKYRCPECRLVMIVYKQ